MDEEAVKEKTLRPRGDPKDEKEQADEEENLEQTDRHTWEGRVPGEGNAEAIDRRDSEENERDDAENRRNDRDEICLELTTAQKAPDERALHGPREDDAKGEKADKGRDPERRDVMTGEIEKGGAQPRQIHALACPRRAG